MRRARTRRRRCDRRGSRTTNRAPRSGRFSACTLPPWAAVSRCTIARPSPAPPVALLRVRSARKSGSNSCGRSSARSRAVVEHLEQHARRPRARTRSSTSVSAWRTALSSRLTSTRRSAPWSPSSAGGVAGATTRIPGSTVSAASCASATGSRASCASSGPEYSSRLNVNRSPTRRSSSVALSRARRRWSASPMPCSIASSEPRRVKSGVRRSWAIALSEEAPLLLGGVLLGQRVAQPVGHPAQRRADLGDLPRARADGRDVELPAGDALGVARQAGERGDDPAAQQDHAGDQREHERQQPRAGRRRQAHRTAGRSTNSIPPTGPLPSVVRLPAGRELALASGPLERGGQRVGDEGSAAVLHHHALGGRAGGRELADAGLPGHDLLGRAQLQVGLDLQVGELAGDGFPHAGVGEARAGLLDERGRLAEPGVGVGLLAGTDRPPGGSGAERRRGDGQREPERQPDARQVRRRRVIASPVDRSGSRRPRR